MTLLIVFFTVATAVSFLCSLWEAVLLSITPTFAQMKINEGSALGHQLDQFKKNIDRPLAAILTLNTIAHTVGAIGVGSQASKIWAESNPLITGFVVPAVMTICILILSEIIPKTLGATYWKKFVPFTVHSLRAIILGLYPLIWLTQLITKMLKHSEHAVLTRTDFVTLAEIANKEGVLDQSESAIIQNLFQFKELRAKDIMTPRIVVHMAPEDQTLNQYFEQNESLTFSRIPLHEPDDREAIHGFVLKDDLLQALVKNEGEKTLKSIMRPITIVKEEETIGHLFTQFLENRGHIALVLGPYGGLAGLVSMEDVLETLLGLEIVDESDNVNNMQQLARQKWEQRAKKLGLISGKSKDEK